MGFHNGYWSHALQGSNKPTLWLVFLYSSAYMQCSPRAEHFENELDTSILNKVHYWITSPTVLTCDSFFMHWNITRLFQFIALWSTHNFHATEWDCLFPISKCCSMLNNTQSSQNTSSKSASLCHNIHSSCSIESKGHIFIYMTLKLSEQTHRNVRFIIFGSLCSTLL